VNADTLLRQLTEFFKAARHLWGRCPRCGELFRLSDAAISFGSEPPKDWLRKLQQQQDAMAARKDQLEDWQSELDSRDSELRDRERDVASRDRNLQHEAKKLAKELLKDDRTVKLLLRQQTQDAVLRSRSTLLGKLYERLAPYLQRFNHDPRDIRAIMDPIDYVCFDGLTVNRKVERITFVEVKSGTSALSQTQRSIMQAVREGRVGTEIWQFGDRRLPIPQQLLASPGGAPALPSGQDKGGRLTRP
jgi:predicted Holliday junction resolvase-like endonuclease